MSNKINKKEKSMSVKNIIIFFLVGVIVILGGILVFSSIQNTPSGNIPNELSSSIQNTPSGNIQNKLSNNIPNQSLLQPKLLVSEEKWDFGKVTRGEKLTHIFMVKNEGEGDLIITGVKPSCVCIEVSISTNFIKPGESAELKVSYDTTDYVGKDEKHLHIYSNDPQVPDKWISLFVETEALSIPNLTPDLTN
jgi:hypothetical protein